MTISFTRLVGQLRRLIRVHDLDALGLRRGKLQISRADALVKIIIFGVKTIPLLMLPFPRRCVRAVESSTDRSKSTVQVRL